MKLFLIATLVVAVASQRITLIDGIQYRTAAAVRAPTSESIVYRQWKPGTLVATDTYLIVEGENLNVGNVRIALAGPTVQCAAVPIPVPDCDNTGTKTTTSCGLPAADVSAKKIAFRIPVGVITQGNTRYADKICILGDRGQVAVYEDSQITYQVYIPCSGDAVSSDPATNTLTTYTVTAGTNNIVQFPENCASISTLDFTSYAHQDSVFRPQVREDTVTFSTTIKQVDWDVADRRSRTRCCGWRAANALDTANNNAQLSRRWGMCYDPNVQSCCSGVEDQRKQTGATLLINVAGQGKLVNKFTEKCCYAGLIDSIADGNTPLATRTGGVAPFIRLWDDNCPCLTNPVTTYCNSYEACCQPKKFPELTTLQSRNYGSCYDPKRLGCCDTGAVFNSGTQQCCKITGVQSLDVPCPCQTDAHCDLNQACCRQFNPPQTELALERSSCNIYSNYLRGIAASAGQVAQTSFGQDQTGINHRCLGQCLDTRFMICCNGNPCVGAYERCCNDTCCNKVTQSCVMGQRPPVGGRFNDQNVGVFYEVCSTTEALTPIRAVMAFFLPIMLLFVTLTGLAFTLYFSKKQNALNPLSAYEKAIATLSFLVILFAWPLFFSPLYKYGVISIWVSFFSILSATCGVKRLLPVALILQVVLLIYIFDPFGGNEILNLSYSRSDNNPLFGNVADSGLFLSIMGLWKDDQGTRGSRCAIFYANWFIRDPQVEDQARLAFNGAKNTFGYCSREYIATLMIVEILMSMWVIILAIVTLVTFIKNVLIGRVVKQNPFHM